MGRHELTPEEIRAHRQLARAARRLLEAQRAAEEARQRQAAAGGRGADLSLTPRRKNEREGGGRS
jgi:hypothetical protein